uniref:Uncharacterized protein n=1 Tax=Trichinella nativa TaxID=6335 RepID=A0A0V1KGX9_9BILA
MSNSHGRIWNMVRNTEKREKREKDTELKYGKKTEERGK